MKAAASLVAVLLMLGGAALGQTASVQKTAPAEQAAASSEPEVASQPSTPSTSTAATSPTGATPDARAASAGDVPAAAVAPAFAPGAKLFIEQMNGFEQRLTYAIVKKKVPVVLVDEREKADFILSGGMYVKEQGWLKSWVLTAHGKGTILVKDARTGNQVFTYSVHRVDSNETADETLQIWAGVCANHLKKALLKPPDKK